MLRSLVRATSALLIREMATTYGKSRLAYLYAIVTPVMGIILMSVVFSLALRSPPLGTSFALFYATGLFPYTIYREVESKITGSLKYSRQLLSYPSVTYVDALLARFILTALTQVIIFSVVIGVLVMASQTNSVFRPVEVLAGISAAAVLGLGVGALACALSTASPLFEQFWNAVNRPLVFISGVLFLHEAVPQPYRTWLEYNPIVHVVGQMRKGFYNSYRGDYVDLTYVYLFALVCLVMGLVLLNRYYRDLMETL